VADPNRALFESAVRLLAPVLDDLVFVGGLLYSAAAYLRGSATAQLSDHLNPESKRQVFPRWIPQLPA
jgi:hypothetical protein